MKNKTLIDELYFCAAQTVHCYNACQLEKDKDKLQRCMMFDKDCEDICRLTGQVLERDSENSGLFIQLCADICKICADECDKFSDLEHCKKCAEVCRKCAEMCQQEQLIF